MLILYVPWAATLFSVTALSWADWSAVLWLSAPVILLDECLKVQVFVCCTGPRFSGGCCDGVRDLVAEQWHITNVSHLCSAW